MIAPMITSEDQAREYVRELCDTQAFTRLERFAEALKDENSRQNLVSRGTLDSVWQRHIADSAQLLEHVPDEILKGRSPWLDLGTGAGPPGLVIAAMRPEMPVVLVESRKRRVEWLSTVVTDMSLAACKVQGMRLEALDTIESGVISARAFAPLPKLLDLSARFSTARTVWLLPKGRSAAQELKELPGRFGKMFHVEQSKTDAEAGIIVGRLKMRARNT